MDRGWQEVKTSLCSSAGLATSIAGSTPRKAKLVGELGHGSCSAPNLLPWDSARPQGWPRKCGQATWWRGRRREVEEVREQDGQAQKCRGSVGWPGSSFVCQDKRRGHCQSCPGSFPPATQCMQAPCIGHREGWGNVFSSPSISPLRFPC